MPGTHALELPTLRTAVLAAALSLLALAACNEDGASDAGSETTGLTGGTVGGNVGGGVSGGVTGATGGGTTGDTVDGGSGGTASGAGTTSTGTSGSGSSGSSGSSGTTGAVERAEVRAYFFGHSLTDFGQPNSNVGTPMCDLAAIEGQECCGNGRWAAGFAPSTFANYPDPANMQTHGPQCFEASFADGEINSVVMTETNFYWKNSVDTSVDAGATFVETMRGSYYPSGPIFLYEHWPEFDGGVSFDTWKSSDHAGFHDWFASLQDGINAQVDGTRVRLVPVGRVFTRILREVPSMDALGFGDFFVDQDPHGTPTTYFIAGLVHYMVLYGQRPSTDASAVAQLPGYLPDAVTGSYADIVDLAWDELNRVVDASGNSRVW